MKHIIITRCKFDSDEKFGKYLDQIQNYYIPSINSQINKNFEIALVSNENHFKTIRNLIDKNISIKNRPIFLRVTGGSKVPKTELKKLITEIQKILKDNDINS